MPNNKIISFPVLRKLNHRKKDLISRTMIYYTYSKMIFFCVLFFFSGAWADLEILLINLDKRPDKLQISNFQFEQLNEENYTRISGVDGELLLQQIQNDRNVEISELLGDSDLLADKALVTSKNMKLIGCTLSHLKALKYIVDKNITGPVLVLEDDFAADGDAIKKIEKFLQLLPENWAIFYAGHCHERMPCNEYKVGEYNMCHVGNRLIACAHAYVVNGAEVAKKLYAAGNTKKLALADFFAQKAKLDRYIIYPYLFSQVKQIEADVKSAGGAWYTLRNQTIFAQVKAIVSGFNSAKKRVSNYFLNFY